MRPSRAALCCLQGSVLASEYIYLYDTVSGVYGVVDYMISVLDESYETLPPMPLYVRLCVVRLCLESHVMHKRLAECITPHTLTIPYLQYHHDDPSYNYAY